MKMMRMPICALIAVCALLAAACSSGGAPAPTRTPAPWMTSTAGTAPSSPTPGRSATPSGATPTPTAVGATGDSGIEGVVLAGPTCPVERIDSPCPDRPVSIPIAVYYFRAAQASPLAVVVSDDAGRFRVALPPGRYVLAGAPCAPGAGCAPLPRLGASPPVDVRPGGYTEVTLTADTGIR